MYTKACPPFAPVTVTVTRLRRVEQADRMLHSTQEIQTKHICVSKLEFKGQLAVGLFARELLERMLLKAASRALVSAHLKHMCAEISLASSALCQAVRHASTSTS